MHVSFLDELFKIAVKVPFVHGTFAQHPLLVPGAVGRILKTDTNPVAVYAAMASRPKIQAVTPFAVRAAEREKGTATLAFGKMDTTKGWNPVGLTAEGKQELGSIDEARRLVRRLESAPKAERGELWKTLHRTIGSWRNDDLSATLRPSFYRKVSG